MNTRLEIQRRMALNTFVETRGYKAAVEALDLFNVVIIKGRVGTGKTSTALCLINECQDSYIPYKFDNNDLDMPMFQTLMNTNGKKFIILENITGDSLEVNSEFKEWKPSLTFLLKHRAAAKIIITTYGINQDLRELVRQNLVLSKKDQNETHCMQLEQIMVDLDQPDIISDEEKKEILKRNCDLYSRDFPSASEAIVSSDSFMGYPKMCSIFCSDDENFAFGLSFFRSPTVEFINKIKRLKRNGIDNNKSAIKYTVLVYIALADNNFVSLRGDSFDIYLFNKIFGNIFSKQDSDKNIDILKCAQSFKGQYLEHRNPDEFQFCHPWIQRAVLITYGEVSPIHLIETVCFSELLTIIRPSKHKRFHKEAIVTISKRDGYLEFSKRAVEEVTTSESNAKKVGLFLKEYAVRCNDVDLIETFLQLLKSSTELQKHYKYIPYLITLFYEMTNSCRSVFPLTLEPRHFRLTWEMITAMHFDYEDTFNELIENVKTENECENLILSGIDEFNNSLLHYLVVRGYDSGLTLCNEKYLHKSTDLCKNIFGNSPLFFAAYLGRLQYFEILLRKSREDKSIFTYIKSISLNTFSKFSGRLTEVEMQFLLLEKQVTDGRKSADKVITETTHRKWITINSYIVPVITFGKQEDYDELNKILNDVYIDVKKSLNKNEIESNVEADDFNYDEGDSVHESDNDESKEQNDAENSYTAKKSGQILRQDDIFFRNRAYNGNDENNVTEEKLGTSVDSLQSTDEYTATHVDNLQSTDEYTATPVDNLESTDEYTGTPVDNLKSTVEYTATPVDNLQSTDEYTATPVDNLQSSEECTGTPVDNLKSTEEYTATPVDNFEIIDIQSLAVF